MTSNQKKSSVFLHKNFKDKEQTLHLAYGLILPFIPDCFSFFNIIFSNSWNRQFPMFPLMFCSFHHKILLTACLTKIYNIQRKYLNFL